MNAKDAPAFFQALATLAVHHRHELDKVAARTYYEGLKEIELDVLQAAIGRLIKYAGEFMPTNGEIRRTCDEVLQDRAEEEARLALKQPDRLALTGQVDQTPRTHYHDCNVCEDTGLRPICPGCASPNECSKPNGRYCPDYREGRTTLPVGPCPCAATNPTILRRKKLAAQPEKSYSKPKRRRAKHYGGGNFYQDND